MSSKEFRRGSRIFALSGAALMVLTGCGATVESRPTGVAAGYPVTVTNCGKPVSYDRAPERVVTNDPGIAEIMFALGLGDRMAGYVLSSDHDGDVATSPWKAEFDRVPRLAEKVGKEVVQGANADLVFAGWNYGFSEASGFTPDSLSALGIGSYLLTEACRNGVGTQRGIMPPLEALYTDLRNLGTVFGVADRAERLIIEYRSRVAAVEQAHAGAPKPKVFLYDDGTDQPLTSGGTAAPQQIIEKAGGTNIFGELNDSWARVNWEAVVQRDPEVIVINDYGAPDNVEVKKRFLREHPALSEVRAVRENRIVALRYADLVESPRNPAAIETLATHLHP